MLNYCPARNRGNMGNPSREPLKCLIRYFQTADEFERGETRRKVLEGLQERRNALSGADRSDEQETDRPVTEGRSFRTIDREQRLVVAIRDDADLLGPA